MTNLEQIKKWYDEEKKSYRFIMKQLGINCPRKVKKLVLQAGCTIRYGGDAVATQWINNQERKKQTSDRAKINFEPFRHLPHDEETKQKIGLANKGEKNGMFGKCKNLNPSYLGGKENWKKGRKIKKEKRLQIIQKLGGFCFKCKSKENLTIHHDPPWRVVRSHELKYLQLLCSKCHFHGPVEKR